MTQGPIPTSFASAGAGGQALLRFLESPPRDTLTWGSIRSFVVALVTFGLWPLLAWHNTFSEVVARQNILWSTLTQWLHHRSGTPHVRQLGPAPGLHRRPLLGILARLVAAGVVASFVHQFYQLSHIPYLTRADLGNVLLDATYRFQSAGPRSWWWLPLPRLFMIWSVGLSIAYGLHWLRVKLYTWDLRRQVGRLNAVLMDEGVAPIALPETGMGLRPLWVIGAVAFAALGVLWGVPMMLAGGLQRDAARRVAPELRRELADRVRNLLATPPRPLPAAAPEGPTGPETCPRAGCGKSLPAQAVFCPRCGTRLARPLHLVA